jgi:hypothetical protein
LFLTLNLLRLDFVFLKTKETLSSSSF